MFKASPSSSPPLSSARIARITIRFECPDYESFNSLHCVLKHTSIDYPQLLNIIEYDSDVKIPFLIIRTITDIGVFLVHTIRENRDELYGDVKITWIGGEKNRDPEEDREEEGLFVSALVVSHNKKIKEMD